MQDWQPLRPYEYPPRVAALRHRSSELVQDLAGAAAEPGSGVQHLVGLRALVFQLRRIAPSATSSSWVMQPDYSYDPEDPGVALGRAARLRGVETQLITRPATVRTHPLLSSIYPATLLGPVFLRALVIDGRQVIVGGPDDPTGLRTSWYTTVPEIVEAVVHIWQATLPLCEPILSAGQEPPLTQHHLEVARLLCLGATDDSIAEELGTPLDNVRREVETLLAVVGASSRTEAVLNMRGRGVNGGWHSTYA